MRDQSLFKLEGVGVEQNLGDPQFFLVEHGSLEKVKRSVGRGSSFIKVRNFHLPYFGIMIEGGPELFFVRSQ